MDNIRERLNNLLNKHIWQAQGNESVAIDTTDIMEGFAQELELLASEVEAQVGVNGCEQGKQATKDAATLIRNRAELLN